MSIREIRCHAECDERFCSNQGLNQLVWDMQGAGWYVQEVDGVFDAVLCPEHYDMDRIERLVAAGVTWLVECWECDYAEYWRTKEEAKDDVYDHNRSFCDCGCIHDAKVVSPEEQQERRRQTQAVNEKFKREKEARDVHDRYVAFLVSKDQERRRQEMTRSDSLPYDETRAKRDRKMFLWSIAALACVALLLILSGCGVDSKYTERYQDAERGENNSGAADTITFPDGFSNVAGKCDHGNRVYVLFHEDQPYGSLAVVPNAEGC